MVNYYDIPREIYESVGLDYDLCACLEYNPQGAFVVTDIRKVLAVWEGENDGDDWRWVLQLKDERYVFLQGGCDYTGWDCRSSASHAFIDSPDAIEGYVRAWSPSSYGGAEPVLNSLRSQLNTSKSDTWRQRQDRIEGI